jgi:hypothetical protein
MAKARKAKPVPPPNPEVPLLVSVVRRDDHKNPEWLLSFPNTVKRMDNSLALQQVWGTLESETKRAEICSVLGGFVVMVNVKDKTGKGAKDETRRYAFVMRPFLEHIIHHDDELRQAPRMENRRRHGGFDEAKAQKVPSRPGRHRVRNKR